MEISLRPEIIATIGNFSITNSLFTSLATTIFILAAFFLITKKLVLVPRVAQNVFEVTIETLFNLNEQLAGKRAKKIFPWFAGFFIFILICNLIGLLPGFGTIGFYRLENEHSVFVPLLRPVNSDLNMTLSLALISVIVTHYLSIQALGLKEYLSRFFSLNPINLFVGLLELVSEFTKLVSFSFRLFGNIFAGEAVLASISKMFAFILPLPFIMLELIVAFVQALIFSMLTMVFMVILTNKHHE